MLCAVYRNIYFLEVYSSPGVPLTDLASDVLVLNGREREEVVYVCAEAKVSLGLSHSGSTFMRNQRPREE